MSLSSQKVLRYGKDLQDILFNAHKDMELFLSVAGHESGSVELVKGIQGLLVQLSDVGLELDALIKGYEDEQT